MRLASSRVVAAASILYLSLAVPGGDTGAQSMQTVAGTYTAVSVPAFGDKPRGTLVLGADGRYALVVGRATMPKIASGSRTSGTAAENKTVVDGSIAHYGRYTIDDGGKTITFHVEMSTFPNWDGTSQKRPLKISGDTLTYTVTAPSAGGPANDVVWRRIQ